jgi:hypothetical protein
MAFGIVFCKIRYPAAKYFFVAMIVAGVILFMYKDEEDVPHKSGQTPWVTLGTGELLLGPML